MKCLALLLLATGIVQGQTAPPALKEAYKGLFHIGAALNTAQFEDRAQLLIPSLSRNSIPSARRTTSNGS